MEQTFKEQCKEDSRLAKKLVFVALNIDFLNSAIERHLICKDKTAPKPDKATYLCQNCNRPVTREIDRCRDRRKLEYCSTACRIKLIRTDSPKLEKCFMCRKYFIAYRHQYEYVKNKNEICCSVACSNKKKRVAPKVGCYTCSVCGVSFERLVRKQKKRTPCCSIACAARYGSIKAAAARSQAHRQAGCP